MAKVGIGEFGGCGLGGAKFAEGENELVVDCATILEEGDDDGLESLEAGVVEFGAGVGRVGKLLLGAIVDLGVAKRSVLGFGWKGMAPFEEKVLDVVLDGKTVGAFCVVPVEVDVGETGAVPVLVDIVVLKEDVTKVVGMAFSDVFDAKVVEELSRRGLGNTCGAIGRGWWVISSSRPC